MTLPSESSEKREEKEPRKKREKKASKRRMLSRQLSSKTKVFKRQKKKKIRSRGREEEVFDEAQNHYSEASKEKRKGKKGHVNSRDQAVGGKT